MEIDYFNYDGIYEKVFKDKENNYKEIEELITDFFSLEERVELKEFIRYNIYYNNKRKFPSMQIPIFKSNLFKYLINKYNEGILFDNNYTNDKFMKFLIDKLSSNLYHEIKNVEYMLIDYKEEEIKKQMYEKLIIDYFNDLFYDIRLKEKLNRNEKYFMKYSIEKFYNNIRHIDIFKEIFFDYLNNEDFLADKNFTNQFVKKFLLTET